MLLRLRSSWKDQGVISLSLLLELLDLVWITASLRKANACDGYEKHKRDGTSASDGSVYAAALSELDDTESKLS